MCHVPNVEKKAVKHTPGPWEAVDLSEGERTKFSIIHNGPLTYVTDNGDGMENCEANAKLIAAAPELLEACVALIKGYTHGDCYNTKNPYVRPYVKNALQLIAKIRGIEDCLDALEGMND